MPMAELEKIVTGCSPSSDVWNSSWPVYEVRMEASGYSQDLDLFRRVNHDCAGSSGAHVSFKIETAPPPNLQLILTLA